MDYYVLDGENEKLNLATCSSKLELKVASCVEQTTNQYRNIAPQHCRVPIKRTSGLTVKIFPCTRSVIHKAGIASNPP